MKPSPEIGKILDTLLDEVMEETTENTHDALMSRAIQLIAAGKDR